MFKKGQAAMEFLMTYGWAILVVLAAIGALAYFGVLSPEALLPERTTFAAPLANVDTAMITTNSAANTIAVAVAFTNNVGYGINVTGTPNMTGAELDGTGYTCNSMATPVDQSVSNSGRFTYTWTCTTANVPTGLIGKRFKANLEFGYVNTYTTQARKHTGTVNGKVQTST